MDSSNFKNFSRFFSLVLCTRVYLCVYLPQFEIAFEVFFFTKFSISLIYMSQVLQQFISKLHFHSFLNILPARKERQVVTSSWKSIVAARN